MGYFYGVFVRELGVTPLIKALPVIPVERGNIHVTIVYIGDKRPDQRIDDRVGVSVGSMRCFRVRLGQLTLLPSIAKPRVLAIDIVNNEFLGRLRSMIMSILRDSGTPIGDKFLGNFHPHITLAYIKSRGVDPEALLEAARELGIERELMSKSLLINSISLILARGGNYIELSRHELQC